MKEETREKRARKFYTKEETLRIARQVKDLRHAAVIAKKNGIPVATVATWFTQFKAFGAEFFEKNQNEGKRKSGGMSAVHSRLTEAFDRIKRLEEELSLIKVGAND